jgi:hypothetical protein
MKVKAGPDQNGVIYTATITFDSTAEKMAEQQAHKMCILHFMKSNDFRSARIFAKSYGARYGNNKD